MRLVLVLLLSSLASAQGMGGKSGIGGKAGFGGGAGAIPGLDAISATNCRTTSVTTQTCALNVVSGDQILVGVFILAPSTPSLAGTAAICDGTYTLQGPATTSALYATSTATGTGSCTITLTNGASSTLALIAASISHTSGIDVFLPASSLTADGFKAAGSCPSTNTFTFPAVTTTASNDYVIGLVVDSDNNNGTFTACDGLWTVIQSGNRGFGYESATQVAPGSVTPGVAAFTTNGTTLNVVTVAYKP